MALMLKDDPEIHIARLERDDAVNKNREALCDLLECFEGAGEVARARITQYINQSRGEDGQGDFGGL